jgi:DNA (cytosine-5)-methyltransferase 1
MGDRGKCRAGKGGEVRAVRIADLFCGAGGSSTGAMEAAQILGYRPELTAVNHWDRAIETHQANHPGARHLCTGVDNINPRDLYAEDELDVLIASPECTHFSTARGGRPVNEQSRATAMCVIRWAETMRPPIIMIENVPEFRSWGPLIRKRVRFFPTFEVWNDDRELLGKKRGSRQTYEKAKKAVPMRLEWVPDPKRKGELFEAWLTMLRAIGYKVDHRIICCANYGDPTTRKRLFIQAVRGARKIVWPHPTHLEDPESELALSRTRPWPTARNDVIDWSLQGLSIYSRKKPLSAKTMARIMAGLEKFGLKPFIVPQQQGGSPVRSVDRPAPTVTTTSRGVKLIEPFLVNMKGKSKGASVDKPSPAVTGGQHLMLAEPFIVPNFGEREGQEPRVHSIDAPAPAVTGRGAGNLIQPCLIKMRGTNNAADVDKPSPTVTGSQTLALAEFIIQTDQTGSNGSCARSTNRPLGAVVSKQNVALVRPYLVQVNHGNGKREKNPNNRRTKSVDAPLGAVCGQRSEWAVCDPALLPQHGGGALRSVDQPAPTIATDGAVALVEPYLVKFYGTGRAASVDKPLDTCTAKARFGLARPVVEIQGQRFLLDIRFRMLQPHELAAAQGFHRDYKFKGNKTEIVKQIGNAVPRRTLRALILAAMSQTPDVSFLLDQEDAA